MIYDPDDLDPGDVTIDAGRMEVRCRVQATELAVRAFVREDSIEHPLDEWPWDSSDKLRPGWSLVCGHV